jgi:uncharacterized protein
MKKLCGTLAFIICLACLPASAQTSTGGRLNTTKIFEKANGAAAPQNTQAGASKSGATPANTPQTQTQVQTKSASTSKAPIFKAAAAGQQETVESELAEGARVNDQDAEGFGALHHAAYGGHEELCLYLLDQGALINLVSATGDTPLLLASSAGHENVVKLLIEKDAKLDPRSANGMTALLKASFSGHAEVVEVLLEAGADASVKDARGRTALELAEKYRQGDWDRTVRILKKASENS